MEDHGEEFETLIGLGAGCGLALLLIVNSKCKNTINCCPDTLFVLLS